METVNLHEARAKLSKLVDRAVKGEPFIIAKAGKPLVKVVALDASFSKPKKRIGMLEGHYTIPDDFKSGFAVKIEEMSYGAADPVSTPGGTDPNGTI